ncbi:MAG TPA: bacterial proteasome activator family protein [Acidimicrobiales bacterium]
MSDDAPATPESTEALRPEVVDPTVLGATGPDADGSESDDEHAESIEQPAKLLRIGSMVKQLLEEVRLAPLDEASRERLREIYEQSIRELADGLSPDLVAELDRVSIPFDSPTPSDAELRIAHAQLVGWLEGLFHGIQATLVAQQVAARAQLDEMRQRSLGGGDDGNVGRPGTYL